MRILVHIGLPHCGADALQTALDQSRSQLLRKGVLFSSAAGRKNHTKLYMAVTDPDHVDPLRLARGFGPPALQDRLRQGLVQDLVAELARHPGAGLLVLSAPQLATLPSVTELERLRALLAPLSDDITIVAHVDEQARVLLRHYADTLQEGRRAPLTQEIDWAASGQPWEPQALAAALSQTQEQAQGQEGGQPDGGPAGQDFPEIQAVPHWLDYAALAARWQQVFGQDKLMLRPYDPTRFTPERIWDELGAMLGIKVANRFSEPPAPPEPPVSAITLVRWRQINLVMAKLLQTGRVIPRALWRSLLAEVALPSPPPAAGALAALSRRFTPGNTALQDRHPALQGDCLKPDPAQEPWAEPDPGFGFRATQYVAAFLPSIDDATAKARQASTATAGAQKPGTEPETTGLTPTAERLLSDRAKEFFHAMKNGRFAPHNRIGLADDSDPGPAFAEIAPRPLPAGSSGKVIVGCMKNEAPYILEWIAYHRQIGIDNFLIYTNDCSDGTDELLDRLQAMGILQHDLNNEWKGNSPQQHALNRALREDVVRNAEWLIHIDVDEFINVRVGNGTLDDFLALVPQATNVAMTWRMFGHNGVERFEDRLVISQFDGAAPKYCPKPHTSWGFKTMTRNLGAYAKLSCHRPNKLDPAIADRVQWVNGSGIAMSPRYHEKGWRSDLVTIGYDMLQLNHYALRSAESFLVKRQRGRALHVDRSIGLNYWVRMDWSTNRDVTIRRNIPRVEAEMARLLADPELRRLHEAGVAWHRAKMAELHGIAEFEDLYQQALTVDLTEMERVAFALALEIDN